MAKSASGPSAFDVLLAKYLSEGDVLIIIPSNDHRRGADALVAKHADRITHAYHAVVMVDDAQGITTGDWLEDRRILLYQDSSLT